MDTEALRSVISSGLGDCEIELQIDGNKIFLDLVADVFVGLSRVKRQQLVYSLLNELIISGEIHAVTMKTVTPEERRNS
ncbi:MAG: BolA/IbaG family iron-sulfur metabolism protein [Pseudomonadales bacterium]|jgi:acid stress-induced BolA-like protein IbaG/YrbA|nr:BolA/IbaG family iron-sulfur metabolism protein [Pseudomonadales bacterium]